MSHEDVLPYIPSEPKPINHELFERFFAPSYGKGKVYCIMCKKHNNLEGKNLCNQAGVIKVGTSGTDSCSL